MKPFYLLASGVLAALLAGAASAQFNTDALKKMQKEGHKIVEERQGAEAAPATKGAGSPAASAARRMYRFGTGLCLDARGALTVETCNVQAPSQQWTSDANGRLVAFDGRCLAGASLVNCAGATTQTWVHDQGGRLRNEARQCLQPRSARAGALVSASPCSAAPTQVWVAFGG